MTNARMTNDALPRWFQLDHWDLVIHWSLDIGHWTFSIAVTPQTRQHSGYENQSPPFFKDGQFRRGRFGAAGKCRAVGRRREANELSHQASAHEAGHGDLQPGPGLGY